MWPSQIKFESVRGQRNHKQETELQLPEHRKNESSRGARRQLAAASQTPAARAELWHCWAVVSLRRDQGKVLPDLSKGVQKIPPPNMPLWHKDYFEPNASKKQQTQEDLPGLALPDKRHVSVCGGVYPFHLLDQEGEHHRHHWGEKAGVKMRSAQTNLAKITLIFCKLPPCIYLLTTCRS